MTNEEQASLFQSWLRDHIGLILKVVRTHVSVNQDQDDLFQEILVNIWSSIPRFRRESKESTWIYRISINTALVWRRAERRRLRKFEPLLNCDFTAASESERESDQRDAINQLYAGIRQLPAIDRSIALMHLDGLSYQEMADVLGISENNIGVKLTRIRKQLAAYLEGVSDVIR